MKALRSTSLTVAITGVLSMSGCSTSSEIAAPLTVSPEAALDGTVTRGADTEPVILQGTGVLKLDADYPSMLEALAGYRLESQAEDVMLLGDSAALSAIGSTLLETGEFNVLDRDETLTSALVRTSYSCQSGGEMIIENGSLTLDEEEYTHRVSLDNYHFDQCRTEMNGEQAFSGSLSVLNDYVSGRHFSVRRANHTWTDFAWQQSSGVNISSNAVIEMYTFNSFDSQQYRNASIAEFSMTRGSEIVEQVLGGEFRQSAESSANGAITDYEMSAAGSVTNASGIAVRIVTEPAISSRIAALSLDLVSAFKGLVQMTAEDGSELSLAASRAADAQTLQVDVEYRNAAGVSRSQLAQNLVELPFVAP